MNEIFAEDLDKKAYTVILRAIDLRRGKRDWKQVADALAKAGIKTVQGKNFTADGARIKFYALKNKYDTGVKLTHYASSLTGKSREDDSRAEAQNILKLLEGVLKLDADPETKLGLIRKIL